MEKKTPLIPPPKRRKVEPEKGNAPSQTPDDKTKTPLHSTLCPMPLGRADLRVQQAKKFAVIQAQQEGCLGNFRSFDSPFGNYLVPVIPTHADLFRTNQEKNH